MPEDLAISQQTRAVPVATDVFPFISNPTGVPAGRASTFADAAAAIAAGGGLTNAGSPEASVTAAPGSLLWDTTNLALWVKNTGTGNTGWVNLLSMA